MKLTLLGTGSPAPNPARRGPSQTIQAGGDLLLIDCGAGAVHRLVEAGQSGRPLRLIAFTHLHSDHVTGLADLLWAGWVGRWWQQAPPIYGPPGTARFVGKLMEAFAYDIEVRRRGEKLDMEALVPRVQEVEEGWQLDGSSWRLTAFRVDHEPVDQAFGYRVDEDSASIVLSGDTRFSPNLVRHAQGADLLLHEVYWGKGLRALAQRPVVTDRFTSERLQLIMGYHTPSDEVGKVAAAAGVRHLVLNHLILGLQGTPADLLEDITPEFGGQVTVGEDLMSFQVGR